MWAACLICLVAGATTPPALTDPAAAAEAAEAGALPPRQAAEILLLTGRPEAAAAQLEPTPTDPRGLRLLADAWVAAARGTEGGRALDALEAHPGWQKHAGHQRARLGKQVWAKRGSRLGLALFAICLAALALGGARELLRIHPETLGLVAVALGAVLLARGGGPTATFLAALVGASLVMLGHGAIATARRSRPGPRGRLFVTTLFLFGIAGVVAAVVFGLGVGPLLGGLAAGA